MSFDSADALRGVLPSLVDSRYGQGGCVGPDITESKAIKRRGQGLRSGSSRKVVGCEGLEVRTVLSAG
ncbi:MAG: hypothetical protein ACYC61_31205, partial [Isosphaeraceae bacterium]